MAGSSKQPDPARRKIHDMAESSYSDPELAAAIVRDAEERSTVEHIEEGRLVLPTEADAQRWHSAKKADEAAKAER